MSCGRDALANFHQTEIVLWQFQSLVSLVSADYTKGTLRYAGPFVAEPKCLSTHPSFFELMLGYSHFLSHSLTHSPTHPPTYSHTHPLTQPPSHPLTHLPTHPPIHPLTHSPEPDNDDKEEAKEDVENVTPKTIERPAKCTFTI